MEFGLQFFPDVGPDVKPADIYFAESLKLCGLVDALGYGHIRTVEHYFEPYGGYSPNPIVFLSAAAMASRRARLVTGAVLPVFTLPLSDLFIEGTDRDALEYLIRRNGTIRDFEVEMRRVSGSRFWALMSVED